MDKNKLRLEKLRSLVKQYKSVADFCRKRSQPGKRPLNPRFLNQLLRGCDVFGERAAHNLEVMAGLGHGYFDVSSDCVPNNISNLISDRNKLVNELVLAANQLSDDGLNRLIGLAEGLMEKFPRTSKANSVA